MEMTLLNNFLLNIPLEMIFDALLYVTAGQLLKKRWSWRGYVRYLLPFALLGSAFGVFLLQSGLFYSPFYWGQILNVYEYLLVIAVTIYLTWERDWEAALIAGSFSVLIQWSTQLFSTLFQPYVLSLDQKFDLFLYMAQDMLLYPVFGVLMLLLLKKVRFEELLWHLMSSGRRKRNLILVSVLHPLLTYLVVYLLERHKDFFWNELPVAAFLMLLVVLGICGEISGEELRRAKLREQEQLLEQQNLYISNLERMQEEMRSFRHDYKNLLSGLYLSAEEEDGGERVKKLLAQVTGSFDEQIGRYIRQTTQLGNLRVTELRSLILGKMTEMQRRGIACHLEILYPVEAVAVPVMELNRCLGILIDNAAEAVECQDSPSVDILISEQRDRTSFIIRNPATGPVDFSRIWKKGYSTKGAGRGLGLYNYQRLVERYDNLLASASCRDGVFTQQLDVVR